MLNDRNKFSFVTICFWLSLLSLSARSDVQALSIEKTNTHINDVGHGELTVNVNGNGNALQTDATVPNFSPRLDYNNEWRPVGRGDPLKNDPTFDYSPPALERVRYWRAENESKDETNNPKIHKKDSPSSVVGKKDILLLGMPHERQRGQSIHSETSVLQPKYTSIRRSYYAHQHQLPTHLMPPPMQTLASPMNSIKANSAADNRHSMATFASSSSSLSSSPSTTTTTTSMSMMHSKPYYATSSSPWMHSTMHSSLPSSSLASMMQHYRPQSNAALMMHNHDHHHQESMNQFTYTRPNLGAPFTSNNFIESNQNSLKPRKPWLHELLQKEVVKLPPKTVVHKYSEHIMSPSVGISSTYPPVAFVPLPMSTTTTTTPKTPISTTTPVYTTTSPVYFTTTMAPIPPIVINSPITSTTNRLLIPTTSNLIHRPTVTPMEMTTDALFKHYKQPEKPLLGPMYLIIEGHSKVKTYGKDELDPHRPKIVPIIPKREPVVRVADPNEKRGTVETFQVKHLHTKVTAPLIEATRTTKMTMTTTTTTSNPKSTTTTTIATATSSKDNATLAAKETTTTTNKPETINDSTTTYPTTNGMQGFFNFLDSSFGSLFGEESSAIDALNSTQQKQTPESSTKLQPVTTTTTTMAITSDKSKLEGIEARIGTHGSNIESLIDFNDEIKSEKITTEPVPRDVRQVSDYDQLPESRLKDRIDINSNEEKIDDDDALEDGIIDLNDESIENIDIEDMEYEDENHELIKRIDKLVDDVGDESEDVELEELIDSDDDLEMRRTKEA